MISPSYSRGHPTSHRPVEHNVIELVQQQRLQIVRVNPVYSSPLTWGSQKLEDPRKTHHSAPDPCLDRMSSGSLPYRRQVERRDLQSLRLCCFVGDSDVLDVQTAVTIALAVGVSGFHVVVN